MLLFSKYRCIIDMVMFSQGRCLTFLEGISVKVSFTMMESL